MIFDMIGTHGVKSYFNIFFQLSFALNEGQIVLDCLLKPIKTSPFWPNLFFHQVMINFPNGRLK